MSKSHEQGQDQSTQGTQGQEPQGQPQGRPGFMGAAVSAATGGGEIGHAPYQHRGSGDGPQMAPELQHAFGGFGATLAWEFIQKVAVMAEPHFLAFIQSLLDARKANGGSSGGVPSSVPYQ